MKYCCGPLCHKEIEDDQFSPGQFKDEYGQCRACQSFKRKRRQEKRAQEPIPANKQCSKCREIKSAACFSNSELMKNGGVCKSCRAAYAKVWREQNSERIAKQKRAWYDLNRDEVLADFKMRRDNRSEEEKAEAAEYHRQWYNQHKEERTIKVRVYRENMTEEEKIAFAEYKLNWQREHRDERNARYKERRQNDPCFRLRQDISGAVNVALKRRSSSKNNSSILAHLPSPIEDIIVRLEKLFSHPDNLTPDGKVWMTWNNWGKYYRSSWDDNDPTTWKWQLDHIIPQLDLPYTSMEDENFKRCWALENLRPYSAKLNQLDGASRTRHKKQ